MAGFIFFTVGRKGSGKSLFESRRAIAVMNGYYRSEKKHPKLPRRIYFSKQKFADRVEKQELVCKYEYEDQDGMPLPEPRQKILNPKGHLYYWNNAHQLLSCPRIDCWKGSRHHPLHNADIFWDEIADDISREKWNEIPEDLRQIFSHCRKRGNRIFANTQKYEMVAIDFRRQIDVACWCIKVIGSRDIDVTRPNPKLIFVMQMVSYFDPMDMENENDPRNLWELREGWPKFYWYTKKDVSVFDTHWEVPPTVYNIMKEVRYRCSQGDSCTDPKGKWHIKHEHL